MSVRPHISNLQLRSILDLPPELLARIFTFSVSHLGIKILFTQKKLPNRVVSQVCKHWRAIAFAEPHLWDRIIVTEPLSSSPLNLLHTILSTRGGNSVVELEIKIFDRVNWEKIQSLVSTYPRRLQTLRLIVVGSLSV